MATESYVFLVQEKLWMRTNRISVLFAQARTLGRYHRKNQVLVRHVDACQGAGLHQKLSGSHYWHGSYVDPEYLPSDTGGKNQRLVSRSRGCRLDHPPYATDIIELKVCIHSYHGKKQEVSLSQIREGRIK